MSEEKILSKENLIDGTNYSCRSCGSTVYMYLANSELIEVRPEASTEDRWVSCSNEKCVCHYGQGHFQDMPSWVRNSLLLSPGVSIVEYDG
jgi:hypothetical protein